MWQCCPFTRVNTQLEFMSSKHKRISETYESSLSVLIGHQQVQWYVAWSCKSLLPQLKKSLIRHQLWSYGNLKSSSLRTCSHPQTCFKAWKLFDIALKGNTWKPLYIHYRLLTVIPNNSHLHKNVHKWHLVLKLLLQQIYPRTVY